MDLSGERLLRALELFQEWCDLDAPERDLRLAELAGTDAELAEGVVALLEEDRQTQGADDAESLSLDKDRLGRWLAENAVPNPGQEADVRRAMPERIGDYRVLSILGVGGMGVVYRAEQDSPRRAVAVKVVHPTSLSTERRKRLRQEAEILGRLEHPGIARIYSAGTDDFGAGPQPFFAMEFVEGRPLARYCDEVAASIPERVELIAQACEAVDYAHRLGIVHRDLKPDNVLVQDDGQPRVLDFGVARSLEPGTDATSLRTEDGRLVGTLSYMSPEQVEGLSEGLTPACDVYSLGAMLFEVLAGRTPHDLEGLGLLGALQLLQSKDPQRLGALRRDLRGDLDCIVNRALECHPERRYATAGELADDLRRFLRKEPIVAREPSTLYELRRFVARNPVLVAGAASTLLVLLVGVLVSAGLTLRAVSGERLARQQSYISSIRAVDADLRLGDSTLALEDLAGLPVESRD
jgi:serine/threonine protein kinase